MAATESSTLVQIMEKLSIDVSKNKDLKKEIDDIVSGGVLTETYASYFPHFLILQPISTW